MAKVGQRPQIVGEDDFFHDFPKLSRKRDNFKVTSFATDQYNCIAFAADDRNHWWWPVNRWRRHDYWPPGCPEELLLASFVAAFRRLGYKDCDDGDFENGVEKIAIFADATGPTHAAKQPTNRNGLWKSKLGENVDIEHELSLLEGNFYGKVVHYMKKARHAKRQQSRR
jgi:hypothetical protein